MSHRVLIVDDEKNIRTTLSRALDLEGFEVHLAADGDEGLKMATDVSPDIVRRTPWRKLTRFRPDW